MHLVKIRKQGMCISCGKEIPGFIKKSCKSFCDSFCRDSYLIEKYGGEEIEEEEKRRDK